MSEHNLPCHRLNRGQHCTTREELRVVDQEISEAEGLLAALNAKRLLICGRMNHAHDPMTSKLPSEIVSKIFTNFIPVDIAWDYGICINNSELPRKVIRTTPLLLGAVCTSWRNIAWSTPQLWTSVTIHLVDADEFHVDILDEWLRRSGGLPLYIGIFARTGEPFVDEYVTMRVLETFALYSDRWFYLALIHPLPSFLGCLHFNPPMLHTLKIETLGPAQGIDLGMIPNLKNLYMDPLQLDTLGDIDWTKLTNVDVKVPSIAICLDLFSKASFLTHCTFNRYLIANNLHNTRTKTLRHEHLVFLHLKCCDRSTAVFLSLMEFPVLQHLIVDSQAGPTNLETIINLLRRSHCPLRILEVDLTFEAIEFELHIIPFLAEIPSLETLEFRRGGNRYHGSATGRDSIDPLLTWLSATALTATRQLTFLPNLRNLRIKNMELSYNRILDMFRAHSMDPIILTTAAGSIEESETRQRVRPLRSLHIQVYGQKYNLIDLDIAQGLQRAIKAGFEVTVVADFYNRGHLPFTDILDKSLHPSETSNSVVATL